MSRIISWPSISTTVQLRGTSSFKVLFLFSVAWGSSTRGRISCLICILAWGAMCEWSGSPPTPSFSFSSGYSVCPKRPRWISQVIIIKVCKMTSSRGYADVRAIQTSGWHESIITQLRKISQELASLLEEMWNAPTFKPGFSMPRHFSWPITESGDQSQQHQSSRQPSAPPLRSPDTSSLHPSPSRPSGIPFCEYL